MGKNELTKNDIIAHEKNELVRGLYYCFCLWTAFPNLPESSFIM